MEFADGSRHEFVLSVHGAGVKDQKVLISVKDVSASTSHLVDNQDLGDFWKNMCDADGNIDLEKVIAHVKQTVLKKGLTVDSLLRSRGFPTGFFSVDPLEVQFEEAPMDEGDQAAVEIENVDSEIQSVQDSMNDRAEGSFKIIHSSTKTKMQMQSPSRQSEDKS